jgi:hypothetical protein
MCASKEIKKRREEKRRKQIKERKEKKKIYQVLFLSYSAKVTAPPPSCQPR